MEAAISKKRLLPSASALLARKELRIQQLDDIEHEWRLASGDPDLIATALERKAELEARAAVQRYSEALENISPISMVTDANAMAWGVLSPEEGRMWEALINISAVE